VHLSNWPLPSLGMPNNKNKTRGGACEIRVRQCTADLTSSVAGRVLCLHTAARVIGRRIASGDLCVGKVCKKRSLVSGASPWSL
jgi:hypothetical protein